ncbi:hypothetical protein [Flavobacterium xanthum]|uniref:Uncharacterized protein n=1 Tax=Flavobacterium xanthum TaxID=69322 RepID=A0A1M7G6X6_9FLAO|nr:hypothetical protein [Flavobacterium xanthum]SHM12040.1 hypothetical protein SAMN05443669_102251 [Flavobacterium xanthum]
MKLLTYLFCLFAFHTMYSQHVYQFDCEVRYQFQSKLKNVSDTRSYLINSKDNSYYALKIPIRKNKYKLILMDYDGLIARQIFKIEELEKSGVTIALFNANSYSNPYKYQINTYDFEKHNDSLIDGKRLNTISLVSTNDQLNKNKNAGHNKYLVDPSFDFLPMLEFSTAYEIWKARKNYPNGLLTKFYTYKAKNEVVSSLLFKEIIYRDFKISYYNYVPQNL